MKTKGNQHFGLWELAVLTMLREEPMHPYEMQRLLRERHKDEVLVLKRGSLYHAINRLLKSSLIEVADVSRNGRRPERTTYRITSSGQSELVEWLRKMIACPKHEPSEFMAAVSFLLHLTPDDAVVQLELRAEILATEIAEIEAAMNFLVARITRINLVESEYQRAMKLAELNWVQGLVNEIRTGTLTWNLDAILDAIRIYKASRQAAKTEIKK